MEESIEQRKVVLFNIEEISCNTMSFYHFLQFLIYHPLGRDSIFMVQRRIQRV